MRRIICLVFCFLLLPVVPVQSAGIPWTFEEWKARLAKEDPGGELTYQGVSEVEDGEVSHYYDFGKDPKDRSSLDIRVEVSTGRILDYLYDTGSGEAEANGEPAPDSSDKVIFIMKLVTGVPDLTDERRKKNYLWAGTTANRDMVRFTYDIPGTGAVYHLDIYPSRKTMLYIFERMSPEKKEELRANLAKKREETPPETAGPPANLDECAGRWAMVHQTPALFFGRQFSTFALRETKLEEGKAPRVLVVTDTENGEILGFVPKVADPDSDTSELPPVKEPGWEEMNAMLREITGGHAYADREEMEDHVLVKHTPAGLASKLGIAESKVQSRIGDRSTLYEIPGLDDYMINERVLKGDADWTLERLNIQALEDQCTFSFFPSDDEEAVAAASEMILGMLGEEPSGKPDELVEFPWTLSDWLRFWEDLQARGLAPLRRKAAASGIETREYIVLEPEGSGRLLTLGVNTTVGTDDIRSYDLFVFDREGNGSFSSMPTEGELTMDEINAFLAIFGAKEYSGREAFEKSKIDLEDLVAKPDEKLSIYSIPGTDAAIGVYRDPATDRTVFQIQYMRPGLKEELSGRR